jgi:hypothetical protein
MDGMVTARWQDALMICRKCSKRARGGFGADGRSSLARLLRKAGWGDRRRKARRGIIETGCFKLCPKDAVVVVDTRTIGRWHLVPVGEDRGAVEARLGLSEEE